MHGTIFVLLIKLDVHYNMVIHSCAAGFPNVAVQVKVKASIATGHQIDPPRLLRLTVNADKYGHRSPPIRMYFRRSCTAHEHIGINADDLYLCSKGHAHPTERIERLVQELVTAPIKYRLWK